MSRAVRPRSLRILGVAAALCMLVGTVLAVVFAVLQSRCESAASPGATVLVPHAAQCSAYGTTAGAGVGLLALGAAMIAFAGVAAGARFRKGPPAGPVPAADPDAGADALAEPAVASGAPRAGEGEPEEEAENADEVTEEKAEALADPPATQRPEGQSPP